MRFEGRVALVAGASRNLGKSIAYRYGKEGGSVIINAASSAGALEAAAEEFRAEGIRVLPVMADITDKAQVDEMVARGIGEFGKIDHLIISARLNGRLMRFGLPFFEVTKHDWLAMQAGALSTLFLLQAVLPGMVARRDGAVLAVGGQDLGLPGANRYTKPPGFYARNRPELLRYVQRNFGQYNIRVNLIQPGVMDTSRNPENYPDSPGGLPQFDPVALSRVPLGRPGSPDELASVALFLLSEEASYITGATVPVNGGRDL